MFVINSSFRVHSRDSRALLLFTMSSFPLEPFAFRHPLRSPLCWFSIFVFYCANRRNSLFFDRSLTTETIVTSSECCTCRVSAASAGQRDLRRRKCMPDSGWQHPLQPLPDSQHEFKLPRAAEQSHQGASAHSIQPRTWQFLLNRFASNFE